MIAYFPEPYADESWYSLCARFSDRTKFGTETGTMQALYGSRHAIATVDLPHRLGALVSQLPPGHPCTVDAVIDQHTFLPYYGPFLTTSTYVKARDWMGASIKASVRVKCGACTNRVRPPKYFRSCPECDRENRETLGETYWRRLFQVPGVEVCPVHRIFLEPSDIRLDPLPNRHKYFSAESAHLPTKAHAMDPKDSAHRILHDLARRIDWLLQQDRLNPGLEILHQQHRLVLASKRFATQGGSIRMNDLRREVIAFFGPKLLNLLQCGLPPENGDGWLGQMLRKSNTAAAPLRHLLLLQALEVDLEHFFYPHRFTKVAAQVQPPTGPWPCLNAVCEHRGNPSIGQAEPQPPDTNGTRHLIIHCPHCGFAYIIPDGTVELTRASRVTDYGHVWKDTLKQQWSNPAITLRQMAKKLGVDPKTVKQRAFELGLPFPRQGKRSVTKRGIYFSKPRDTSSACEKHRLAWLQLHRSRPEAGTKELRLQAQALYAWLYRNDRPWLEKNRPARKKPSVTLAHVDWPERDEELAGQIASVAAHIRNSSGKPRRVTVTAIGRVLGKQSLFEAALSKLPLTRLMIKSALESGEAFDVRRVHMAAAKLRQSQGAFPRWKLVCAAGLHHRLEHRPKVKAALDYEMRPPANVIILRNGEPVPQRLLQASTKLPRSIRPLAIVQVAR